MSSSLRLTSPNSTHALEYLYTCRVSVKDVLTLQRRFGMLHAIYWLTFTPGTRAPGKQGTRGPDSNSDPEKDLPALSPLGNSSLFPLATCWDLAVKHTLTHTFQGISAAHLSTGCVWLVAR